MRTYYKKGDWLVICDRCGYKFKASECKLTWDNLFVCSDCWEPRHPQDFVRGKRDKQRVPINRSEQTDTFVFSQMPPTSGLVGYWPMNEGSGSTVKDLSNAYADGTLEGSMGAHSWISGGPAGRVWLQFDGASDRVDCGYATADGALGESDLSIAFIMKSGPTIKNYGMIFVIRSPADSNAYYAIMSNGTANQLRFTEEVATNPNSHNFSNAAVFDEEIYSIAVVWDRTNDLLYLYVDGSVVDSHDISSWHSDISNNGELFWGARNAGASPYDGYIGQGRVYNRALTADEVRAIHEFNTT